MTSDSSRLPPLDERRALITGITGQDGSYLAELLLGHGYQVWGLLRRTSSFSTARLSKIAPAAHGEDSRLHLCFGDLCDDASVRAVLQQAQPHEVYNLAAQSHVQVSFDVPLYTCDVTAMGALRLLEALRSLHSGARFYQASSSEMYGKAVESPQSETTPFNPCSPYAVAKVFACQATRCYREAYGMFAVNGILFNHESPRRGETFVTRKITRAVAAIARGQSLTLYLGNLDARRDWGFARDYVDAMWRMLQADTPRDYVIATGVTYSVRQFCEMAFAHAGLSITWRGHGLDEQGLADDGRVLVAVDPRHFRPTEVERLQGDARLAHEQLGWAPLTSFDELVRMMVDADLKDAEGAGAQACSAVGTLHTEGTTGRRPPLGPDNS